MQAMNCRLQLCYSRICLCMMILNDDMMLQYDVTLIDDVMLEYDVEDMMVAHDVNVRWGIIFT